ncbi:MAG: hypothetical protein R2731_02210 [Nocardioides sp.]
MVETSSAARRAVFWASLAVAALVIVLMVVQGPPGGGYGWWAVAVNIVVSAGLVLLVGWLVREARPHLHWWTVALAVVLAVMTAGSTLGNLGLESTASEIRDVVQAVVVIAFAAGAISVEVLDGRHLPSAAH